MQTFFEICIHRKFLQTEQFMCSSGIYSFKEIFTTLQRSERELLQLKFRYTHFWKNSDRLFEAVSSKIQTLSFFECSFHRKVFEKIIVMCSNLKRLTITSTNCKQLRILLVRLKRRNIVKTDVIFLEINLIPNSQNCFYLINLFASIFELLMSTYEQLVSAYEELIIGTYTDKYTKRIFSIFPNLQYLKINNMFQLNEIPSIRYNGIKELGLDVMYPFPKDNYSNRILSLTKYGQIYVFCAPSN